MSVLVIRAWCEDDSTTSLRARVTAVQDVLSGRPVLTACASAEDIYSAVRLWLEQVTVN